MLPNTPTPQLRRLSLRSPLLALSLLAGGCIWKPIPIPPPMTTSYASTACVPTEDCGEGVVFTIEGLGQAGGLIVATNSTRTLSDGNSYNATTAVARGIVVPDGGIPDGGVRYSGLWRVRFDPVRVGPPGSPVTSCRPGDLITIRQLYPDETGAWQPSESLNVRVPAP